MMPFDSPSTSDPHPDWHDLLAGYALGNLSPAEQATLQQILTEHPELKAELCDYQETLALIPYALEPQPLPHELEDTIVAAAQLPKRQRLHQMLLGRYWYGATMAAAALVIAVVGTNNYLLRQQRTIFQTQLNNAKNAQQTLQVQLEQAEAQLAQSNFESVMEILRQPNALVYSLQGSGTAANSSGSLLTLPNHSEVQLVSHNLPVLPQGQIYRLWSVATETSAPIFCGEFNNTKIGNVQWTVPDDLCSATPIKVIITVDAVVDPPVPKGPPVLIGGIGPS